MVRQGVVGFGIFVMMVGTACGLSGGAETDSSAAEEPTEVPSLPVSINEGLASLDSYRLTFTSDVYDSTSQQRTVTTVDSARDRATDASYTRTESLVTTDAEEVVSQSVEEQFALGNQLCAVSDGEAQSSTVSATAQEMSDLMSQVVILQPLIENPVYVADDVVNGVPVRTYTFELRSIGAASEAEATRADGTYSIAVDGEYLVQYRLDLELRTGAEGDPEAEYTASSFDFSLEQVNQPVEIVFPPACEVAVPVEE